MIDPRAVPFCHQNHRPAGQEPAFPAFRWGFRIFCDL